MKRLLDAPHRIFFFAAAIQVVIASAWWALTLDARARGIALSLAEGVDPVRAHAFLMIYGFFPLFIFGFLFTAGPRWLALVPTRRGQYAVPGLIAAAAAWLMLPAFHLGAGVAAFVLLFMLGAWGWMLGHFVNMIAASRADRLHAIVAAGAIAFGIVGLAATRLWLLTGSDRAAQVMELAGLWGFLVPLFVTVSHRMIPFFTSKAPPYAPPWRPRWTLVLLAGGSVAHGALLAAGLAPWTWIVDAPVGAAALLLAWRWGFARSLAGTRQLAMLHVGFAWLGAAWLLHALQSALAGAGVSALGLAPTHALTIGFLSTLALAMVSRVSSGHSLRRPARDDLTWNVFLLLQAAALARIAADIWTGAYATLLATAAWLWLACFAAWAWRYMPYYWERSAHGRTG